jgi:hypothetical protein
MTPVKSRFRRNIFLFLGLTVALTGLYVSGAVADIGDRSPDGIWTEMSPAAAALTSSPASLRPASYRLFGLDEGTLDALLVDAPLKPAALSTGITMTLPRPDGSFGRFRVIEAPILSPELQAARPHIRTYLAQGIDDPGATVRFDLTTFGFRAQVRSADGDAPQDGDTFQCAVEETDQPLQQSLLVGPPSGSQLSTYRFAATSTGEFTTFWGGTAGAESAITTIVNRMNEVYETEVAISFTIVAFNVYTNAATDPFTNGGSVSSTLLVENHADLNTNVGPTNYDVGHLFTQGSLSGIAGLGVACNNSFKGWGVTGINNMSSWGDPYIVDYVCHEVGHQMGGSHTFNGSTGACNGNRTASSAYEPGSGSTIMAYAGICGAENVQTNSHDYFHTRSFDQITSYRDAQGACAIRTNTGNTPPTANAGADFIVPLETPFTLLGSGSDADSDPLTYCWEQYDLGSQSPPPNTGNGPLFRSYPAKTSLGRTFPRLPNILAGNPAPWEPLPTVARVMNFRLTVRDNRAGGGGVDRDQMQVTAQGDPFFVTSPNGGESIQGGFPTMVTWTVGGGSVASSVRILLSTNGGNSFPTVLATAANDGSQAVTLPPTPTTTARIKIKAIGNIFFDISDDDFEIIEATVPTQLQSFDTRYDGRAVQVTWSLLEIESDATFSLYRVDATSTVTEAVAGAIAREGMTFTARDTEFTPGHAYRYRVIVSEGSQETLLFETAPVTTSRPTFALHPNHPNPFNPSTTISYTLPARGRVTVRVFGPDGALIRGLVNDTQSVGLHTATWNGRDDTGRSVASGIYFVQVRFGRSTKTQKLVLLK